MRATTLSYTTVIKIKNEEHQAKMLSAFLLSHATAGQVSIAELGFLPELFGLMPTWEREFWAKASVQVARLRTKHEGGPGWLLEAAERENRPSSAKRAPKKRAA